MSFLRRFRDAARPDSVEPSFLDQRVLILTPIKDCADCVFGYLQLLRGLSYPHELVSVAFLESDSSDDTFAVFERQIPTLSKEFRSARIVKRDFGYRIPPGVERHEDAIQLERRTILARSRNHLLFRALRDEEWVLWIDADVRDYPSDIIETLLETGKDIVHPHCVLEYGGATFDRNAWRDQGRLQMEDLRGQGPVTPLDAVGGTMLLVRADLHRDGLVFPPFLYGRQSPLVRDKRGEIETEGLGIMAHDMGYQCWGMPDLEIRHRHR